MSTGDFANKTSYIPTFDTIVLYRHYAGIFADTAKNPETINISINLIIYLSCLSLIKSNTFTHNKTTAAMAQSVRAFATYAEGWVFESQPR